MKKIIIHYHLFKNAGSTIDSILRNSFGEQWHNWDRPASFGGKIFPSELEEYLIDSKHVAAISSHDTILPLPKIDAQIYPIIFLRHPLPRARSAWYFECCKQKGLSTPEIPFSEYVEKKLGNGKPFGVIANFQVGKLSNLNYTPAIINRILTPQMQLEIAKDRIRSLDFFGIVEHMQTSLERMYFYLKHDFPHIKVVNSKHNESGQSLIMSNDQLNSAFELELGTEIYHELVHRNQLDLELYDYAIDRYFSIVPNNQM